MHMINSKHLIMMELVCVFDPHAYLLQVNGSQTIFTNVPPAGYFF